MPQRPSLKTFYQYPVTSGITAASIILTVMWWTGSEMRSLMMDFPVWDRWQLWRGFTSTLLHVNIMHLAFNLYWLWAFGTFVEKVYGHFKFAGIVLLLAFTSSMLDFTFNIGGVGLSGVGYGLWTMLWVLSRHDPRFVEAVDRKTNEIFIAWFFFCIVLTVLAVMPVANVAHAAGALTGTLIGLIASSTVKYRHAGAIGLAIVVAVSVAGATLFWPWTTFSKYAQEVVEWEGSEALRLDNNKRAAKLLHASAHMRGAPARNWYNLGIAYQRLKDYENALLAYGHAAQMPDADSEMRAAAKEMKAYPTKR
jgi:GlpG protein